MKKFIKKFLLYFLLFTAIFSLLEVVFTRVYKKGNYFKTQVLYNLKNTEFDYIVHGSSRVYTSLDVGTINKLTALEGYNLALDGSLISTQYLMLNIFLKNNNKVKTVFLQVDPFNADSELESTFTYPRFLPFIHDSVVFNHFKDFGPKWYAYRYIPFLRYAEFNFEWGGHMFIVNLFDLGHNDFDNYGGYFYPFHDYRGENKDPEEYLFNLKGEYKYLNKIIDLCEGNNIQLVLFTSPYANVKNDQAYYKNVESFSELMASRGVEYYNFGDLLDEEFDHFTDKTHLNKSGVDAFSKAFAEFINQRTKPDQVAWN